MTIADLPFFAYCGKKRCQFCDSGLSSIDLAKPSRVKNIQELKGLLFFALQFLFWEIMLSSVFFDGEFYLRVKLTGAFPLAAFSCKSFQRCVSWVYKKTILEVYSSMLIRGGAFRAFCPSGPASPKMSFNLVGFWYHIFS
ncbi:hypothetical protein SAMN02745702_01503 [Desulfobaculum bizertense DSM 18034]|uniref:Uncharacterized protein n=1 Tax=Desulfobaculum bizertense DSM 18034 TaxID=1121442 RepID=A0A1T4W374_9BACT|nr:hypothetical protein SAMN02745702_01503 [Desulfobaculum bizertense DSM 18034]